ncbi:MAG: SH3 domain-containing protein [Marinosulfonomonas sp.]|nr:SH3 domain-containing protein [Marinosulfonomonas sp.]
MFKLTLCLGGAVWVAMAFAPDLDAPVFTEMVAEIAPVVEPAPEVTRSALISPVEVAVPAVVSTPEPVAVAVVAIPEPAPERIIWFVTGSRVNVRGGPSINYEVLGKVVYGEAAEIISDPDADWVKIRIEGDGVEGFIMKRFMTDVDPLG